MRVEWSSLAREDLQDLQHYISHDSTFYAQTFVERVLAATRRLSDFQRSGRKVPEADDDAIREVIVQGYRVMYRIEEDHVLILAVMHGSRDMSNPDNQPWDAH